MPAGVSGRGGRGRAGLRFGHASRRVPDPSQCRSRRQRSTGCGWPWPTPRRSVPTWPCSPRGRRPGSAATCAPSRSRRTGAFGTQDRRDGRQARHRGGGRDLRAGRRRAGAQHHGRLRRQPGSWSRRTARFTCSTRSGSVSPTWSRPAASPWSPTWPGCGSAFSPATTCGSPSTRGPWSGSGAELIVLPSAWAAGLFKEEHWVTLVRARAIENTVWVAAAGQVPDPDERPTRAPTGIGRSMVVDPMGVTGSTWARSPAWAWPRSTPTLTARIRAEVPCLQHRRPDMFGVGRPSVVRGRRWRCHRVGCSLGWAWPRSRPGQRRPGGGERGDRLRAPAAEPGAGRLASPGDRRPAIDQTTTRWLPGGPTVPTASNALVGRGQRGDGGGRRRGAERRLLPDARRRPVLYAANARVRRPSRSRSRWPRSGCRGPRPCCSSRGARAGRAGRSWVAASAAVVRGPDRGRVAEPSRPPRSRSAAATAIICGRRPARSWRSRQSPGPAGQAGRPPGRRVGLRGDGVPGHLLVLAAAGGLRDRARRRRPGLPTMT